MVSASATYEDEPQQRRRRLPVAWLAGLVAAGSVVGLATLDTSRAAFSANTGNSGSSFAAGTVTLGDDDNNSIFFQMTGMVPGSNQEKCVNVTYSGVPALVRLYGSVANTGGASASLAPYLTTEIEEGTGAQGGSSPTTTCTGFTSTAPTPTMIHGTGAANTTLQDFSDNVDFNTGLAAFGGVPTSGTQVRSYRIKVTLQDNNAAQGKNASATFTWEAQNS